MLLLLNTSSPHATVLLAEEGKILFTEENPLPKEHAAWLHPAIERVMGLAGIGMKDLEAVAVVAGPGSYTGLRVGMAAAKGICFALGIPLITQNTLVLMAGAMRRAAVENNALICPMLDARRQEVFTALYTPEMQEILASRALILDKTSFEKELSRGKVIFAGSGSAKWREMTHSPQAVFIEEPGSNEEFAALSARDFHSGKWADPIYGEPIYLKEFHTHAKN